MRLLWIANVANTRCIYSDDQHSQNLASSYPIEPISVSLLYEHDRMTHYSVVAFRRRNCLLAMAEFQTNNRIGRELYDRVVGRGWDALSIGFRKLEYNFSHGLATIQAMLLYDISVCRDGRCPGAHCWIENDDSEIEYQMSPEAERAYRKFNALMEDERAVAKRSVALAPNAVVEMR